MSVMQTNDNIDDVINELERVREFAKQIKKQEKVLLQKLYDEVNEHETIVDEDGVPKYTWKYNSDTKFLDAKRLELEVPDIYNEYISFRQGARKLVIK